MLAPGEIIDRRYRLVAPLGAGGMGVVWAATHVDMGIPVALKFLRCRGATTDRTKRRFVREARATMRIEHPNVLRLFDAFRLEDDTPVLAMELLHGETLAARLERVEVMDWPAFAPILTGIVWAVGAAHRAGIIHRDIKPSNVFLVRDRHGDAENAENVETALVRVLDFGVSKLVGVPADGDGPDTESGATLGTPQYMAPEQALGDKTLSYAVDAWALGVVTYECLSGGRPVEGDSLGQVIKQLLQGSITPLQHVRPDLPLPVVNMVGRLLAESPQDRPCLDEITAWLETNAPGGAAAGRSPRPVSGRGAKKIALGLGVATLFAAAWGLTVHLAQRPSLLVDEPAEVRTTAVAPWYVKQETSLGDAQRPSPDAVGVGGEHGAQGRSLLEPRRRGSGRLLLPRHPSGQKRSPANGVPNSGHDFAMQSAVPGGIDEAPF